MRVHISRVRFRFHLILSTWFSVVWRANSLISVALESYDNALSIVIWYVPVPCIPGTQGSVDCARKCIFSSFELSHANQGSVGCTRGLAMKLECWAAVLSAIL